MYLFIYRKCAFHERRLSVMPFNGISNRSFARRFSYAYVYRIFDPFFVFESPILPRYRSKRAFVCVM